MGQSEDQAPMAEFKSGFLSATEKIFCLCPDSILSLTWVFRHPVKMGISSTESGAVTIVDPLLQVTK